MTIYRVFCMDETGSTLSFEEFEAYSDKEAVEIARGRDLGVKCEVWTRTAFVAAIRKPKHK